MTAANAGFFGALPNIDRICALIDYSRIKKLRVMNLMGAYWLTDLATIAEFVPGPWTDEDGNYSPHALSLDQLVEIQRRTGVELFVSFPYATPKAALKRACDYLAMMLPDVEISAEICCEGWNSAGHYANQYAYLCELGGGDDWQAANWGYASRVRDLAEAAAGRFRLVASTQCTDPAKGKHLLETCGLALVVDAVGIAPYYGPPNRVTIDENETAQSLSEKLTRDIWDILKPMIMGYAYMCEQHGLELICYEMGVHLISTHAAAIELVNSGRILSLDHQLRRICLDAGIASDDQFWYRLWGLPSNNTFFSRAIVEPHGFDFRPNFRLLQKT